VKDSRDHSGHNPETHEGGNETRHQRQPHCVADLSAVDRRALTEMLVDKIIIERHPSKIDKDGRRHSSSAPSHTKILSKRLSGSRRCTRRGSRSSPESERTIN
jgi:hypothetical protein